jgi:hypothetical protein
MYGHTQQQNGKIKITKRKAVQSATRTHPTTVILIPPFQRQHIVLKMFFQLLRTRASTHPRRYGVLQAFPRLLIGVCMCASLLCFRHGPSSMWRRTERKEQHTHRDSLAPSEKENNWVLTVVMCEVSTSQLRFLAALCRVFLSFD